MKKIEIFFIIFSFLRTKLIKFKVHVWLDVDHWRNDKNRGSRVSESILVQFISQFVRVDPNVNFPSLLPILQVGVTKRVMDRKYDTGCVVQGLSTDQNVVRHVHVYTSPSVDLMERHIRMVVCWSMQLVDRRRSLKLWRTESAQPIQVCYDNNGEIIRTRYVDVKKNPRTSP